MTKILDIKIGEVKPSISPEQARDEFAAVIESYKVQNPKKYELKKEAMAQQLAALEAAISGKKEPKVKKSKVIK
jgi:hypothetical protein